MARLAMTDAERDAFLSDERVLRLATIDADGWPAVVPVWFVWHQQAFWIWNLERARRTARLRTGTRCAFVVDSGRDYGELRGVSGRADYAFVGDDAVPEAVRIAFSQRYFGVDDPLPPADHHAWLRLDPLGAASWDFRKR